MSLIIRQENPYNDSKSRAAWRRYCDRRGYLVTFNGQTAEIDGFIQTPNGVAAVELACNGVWGNQDIYPVTEDVYIPSRKLKYFCRFLTDCEVPDDNGNWTTVSKGYFILFNVPHTKAAFIEFATILENASTKKLRILHGVYCDVVTIPHYLLRYIKIPA